MATATVWKASSQMKHQLKYNLFYQGHQTLEMWLKIFRQPLIEQLIIITGRDRLILYTDKITIRVFCLEYINNSLHLARKYARIFVADIICSE